MVVITVFLSADHALKFPHQPFFCYSLLSNTEAVPKRILEWMNEENLTIDDVASHLQAQTLILPVLVFYDIVCLVFSPLPLILEVLNLHRNTGYT